MSIETISRKKAMQKKLNRIDYARKTLIHHETWNLTHKLQNFVHLAFLFV